MKNHETELRNAAGGMLNTVAFAYGKMENSHLGCFGVRASSLDVFGENITAGKMPAFRDRLEAYPPFLVQMSKATELGRMLMLFKGAKQDEFKSISDNIINQEP